MPELVANAKERTRRWVIALLAAGAILLVIAVATAATTMGSISRDTDLVSTRSWSRPPSTASPRKPNASKRPDGVISSNPRPRSKASSERRARISGRPRQHLRSWSRTIRFNCGGSSD